MDIMDIMDQPAISPSDTKQYRRHSAAFKLALVEQTLQPGASVARIARIARIARKHGVNANQMFGWRKLRREGFLDSSADMSAAMLPVTIVAPHSQGRDPSCSSCPKSETANVLRLECAKGRLIIEGVADSGILERVLDRLLR
jgi:transposase